MRIHNPGFAFVIPGVEHLIRTHVRTRTINLPSQQVVLTDRMVFQVGGVLQVRVIDSPEAIYAALFETDYLEGTVSDFATGKMREVLADLTYPEVLARTQVAESTHGLIVGQLAEWGLELIAVNLTDCAPTAQTARTILLGAEAAMRAQALADLAPAVSANLSIRTMSATLAAALIGTPVAAALGGPERRVTNQDNPVQDQDDDE
jgi:regulator of protease activity HflC (stomatin/prohibitin superfamily)